MSTYVPKDVQEGRDAARLASLRKRSRLRVVAGGDSYPVLHLRQSGFVVEMSKVPTLRGLVDLYDGSRHLYQCLIVASDTSGGEMTYEFKRSTPALDHAPLDHATDPNAPIALLPR